MSQDKRDNCIPMRKLEVNHCSYLYSGNVNEPHHTKMCLQGFLTRQDSNQPAQLQRLARGLKFWI